MESWRELTDRTLIEILVAALFWIYCVATSGIFSRTKEQWLSPSLRIVLASSICWLFLSPCLIKKINKLSPIEIVLDDSLSMTRPLDKEINAWRRELELAFLLESIAQKKGIATSFRTASGTSYTKDFHDLYNWNPSNIYSPLFDTSEVSGQVFLFSDGIERKNPTHETSFNLSNPINSVLIGSTHPTLDWRLENLSFPSLLVQKEDASLHASAKVVGATQGTRNCVVQLWKIDGQKVVERLWQDQQTVNVDNFGNGSLEITVNWKQAQDQIGQYLLTIIDLADVGIISPEKFLEIEHTVDKETSEVYLLNNASTFQVTSKSEKHKVLLIDGYPTYEYRYLRETLRREDTIELRTVLFSADPRALESDAITLTLEQFNKKTLASFDVILLGTVSEEWNGKDEILSEVILDENSKTSLWFIGGTKPFDRRLSPGKLVESTTIYEGGTGEEYLGWQIRVTPTGRRAYVNLTNLWDKMPSKTIINEFELTRLYPFVLPYANTEILLTAHCNNKSEPTDNPLMLVSSLGRVKIAWSATDEWWKLNMLEDKSIYRKFILGTLEYLATSKSYQEEDKREVVVSSQLEEQRKAITTEIDNVVAQCDVLLDLSKQSGGKLLDLRDQTQEKANKSARDFFEERLASVQYENVKYRISLAPICIFAPLILVLLVALTVCERRR